MRNKDLFKDISRKEEREELFNPTMIADTATTATAAATTSFFNFLIFRFVTRTSLQGRVANLCVE